ncbi:succinylglutamate desuccinylase/aspartoacylase family protein [Massilia cavernae]|uniref:Succinylglutamate desuccinylase/aspartoacylase family protein n=1 Tax=Massilia cavernae TaxID=2320864 RepID=A0A418Y5E9_9BURK|nr:succinylglutamate desuccinylase/aspartoacylase family protein [Massilia cavernae]RJG21798.1 succinylglutamate desuccinylase/aspartoacylase family protein [Massilia cavernae]
MHAQIHPISVQDSSAFFRLTSLHFGTPGQGRKVYIQAALHADEVPGMLVAQFLRNELASLEAAGKIHGEIILVPAANPIGLSQAIHGAPFGRFDLSTGINFNRAYKQVADELKVSLEGKLGAGSEANVALVREHALRSVQAWQPLNDAEALKKILLGMAIDADIVLDLHCETEASVHIYTGTPLADAVRPLTALMGARALLLALQAGGEPFDEACSRLWWDLAGHFGPAFPLPPSCVATTVELRGETDVNYECAAQDARGLLQYLIHEGVLDQPPVALPEPLCEPTPLEGVEPVNAPHAGVLVYLKNLGDKLEAGDAIADLIDPVSGAVTTLRCTVPGVFFARSASRHLLRGMNVGKVAGPVAFRSGSLLSL